MGHFIGRHESNKSNTKFACSFYKPNSKSLESLNLRKRLTARGRGLQLQMGTVKKKARFVRGAGKTESQSSRGVGENFMQFAAI